MEIFGTISKAAKAVKGILDLDMGLGDPTLASQFIELKRQVTELQSIVAEANRISKEKDEVIAKLKAAMAIKGNMVIDGSAYYMQKGKKVVDGPFCTSCFDRHQETIRLLNAPKPPGAAGRHLEWVQCPNCQTPFRSRQVGEYLKTQQATPARSRAGKSQNRLQDDAAGRRTKATTRRGR